jgi:hypothetical protein
MKPISLGGSFLLANTSLTVNRMGYGAMQLAGPQVWGPPRDPDGAVRILREAVEAGVLIERLWAAVYAILKSGASQFRISGIDPPPPRTLDLLISGTLARQVIRR